MKKHNFKLTVFLTVLLAVFTVSAVGVLTVGAVNSQKPSITIKYGDYTESTVPNGLINCAYTLFDAEVTDSRDSEPTLKTSVYKNYSIPSSRSEVSVIDGKFTPKTSGNYTIEYKATNAYGLSTTVTVPVKVLASAEPISITADNVVGAKQGYEFTIPTPSATGDAKLGRISIDEKLFYGDREMSLEGLNYTPMYSGNYTLKYIARDYAGREEVLEKQISVAHTTELISYDDVDNLIPKYFVSGASYVIPSVYVYEFGTDSFTKNQCAVTIDGVSVTSDKYSADVKSNLSDMELAYSYKGYSKKYTVKGIKSVSQGVLDTTKLFVPYGNASVDTDQSGIFFKFVSDSDKIEFANPLLASELSFVFAVDETKNNYASAVFEIVDAVVPNHKLVLKFTLQGVNINGTQKDVYVNLNGGNNTVSLNGRVLNVGGKSINIDTYQDGSQFNGFKSGFAYLSFNVEEISGESALRVSTLNGNYFHKDVDYIKPKIIITSDYTLSHSINDKFVLPSVKSADVIDGELDCTVSLLYRGNAVKSEDGILLQDVSAKNSYSVKLDKYGIYSLEYESTDRSGNLCEYSVLITVLDEIKPEVSASSVPKNASVNSTVNLPEGVATDNVSESADVEVYILVINPEGKYIHINGNSFKPDIKGEWIVRYYAYDEAGNIVYKDYSVKVG